MNYKKNSDFLLKVRFYEEDDDGRLIWEGFGEFQPSDVHKQYGICFRTPRYQNLEVWLGVANKWRHGIMLWSKILWRYYWSLKNVTLGGKGCQEWFQKRLRQAQFVDLILSYSQFSLLPQLAQNLTRHQWRSQKLVLGGGANLHFCLKISLSIALMYKKFKNSIISSA